MPMLLFELLVSISLVAMTVLSIWRFTSIIRDLAQSTARHDERNAEQRDRFFMQLLENQSVASDAEKAVAMAAIHSDEHLKAHNMNLSRDAVNDKEAASLARKAAGERKKWERQKNSGESVVEGFSG